jgi:hypothetical protein
MPISRKPLTGEDLMVWGEFKGTKMKDLPLSYLDFLLRQKWLVDWPGIKAYVESRRQEVEGNRAKVPTPKTLTTFDEYIKWARK